MKSWAVPKGPSLDPHVKRMAVEVEDHPIGDPQQGYRDGNLKFMLEGEKLHGKWALIRIKGASEKQQPWLLIKEKDAFVRDDAEHRVVDALPDRVGITNAVQAGSAAKSTPVPRPQRKKPGSRNSTMHADASLPAGAVKCVLPESLSLELATLVAAAPVRGEDWLFELKFDGYRLLARIDGAGVTLLTRSGQDWTNRLPHLQQALAALQVESGWLDGEIVVPGQAGIPDFHALQNAFDGAATQDIVFYLFDLPYLAGHDLRSVSLEQRRAIQQTILGATAVQDAAGGVLRFSEAFDVLGAELLAPACKLGLEGVIGKRRDSPHTTRRSKDWIKLKCGQRQEFVIGGYTDPKGARQAFGSLLLGVHDAQGQLQYAGNVGTGFNDRSLVELQRQFDPLAVSAAPFAAKTGFERSAHWVKPQLVAEVAFAGWTGSKRLRHAVFHALRSDKQAQAIVREEPLSMTALSPSSRDAARALSSVEKRAAARPARVKVTHPDKVIDATSGATTMDVIAYYALAGPLMRHHGWDTVEDFSHAIVAHLTRMIPQRFVARSGPANRVGKVFVDYLRNGFGATTAAAWSVRSRSGLGISVPITWDELPQVVSGAQ